ncbi:hypothetical protein HJG60_011732 [Phyllostomus discolor]|uniref:Uncharacterized protein n=1 Tax=Phyllostomus discolor TaxID=89673 RepID=A0A834E1F4_9CHIR|nr:hypothetical protein HJG60_011732 [Phyllostomus discolor]
MSQLSGAVASGNSPVRALRVEPSSPIPWGHSPEAPTFIQSSLGQPGPGKVIPVSSSGQPPHPPLHVGGRGTCRVDPPSQEQVRGWWVTWWSGQNHTPGQGWLGAKGLPEECLICAAGNPGPLGYCVLSVLGGGLSRPCCMCVWSGEIHKGLRPSKDRALRLSPWWLGPI